MLVLNRYEGEAIRIGDATLRVLEIRSSSVKLGIEAPREIHILRLELDGTEETEEEQPC